VSIEATVHKAFANTSVPLGPLFEVADAEGAETVFSNASWAELHPDQLRTHTAAVNFLSPSAFAYFLPAFILAALSEVGVRDSLLLRLLPAKADASRSSFTGWWTLLSQPQKNAVVAFVGWCRQVDDSLSEASIVALKNAAGPNKSLERTRDR
jgi:uncharacterized protein DUF6714